ncbi:Hypothetical protein A7982_04380 [Minicystis rosea]|nr:Hypothetical protein A7982_04380 [Minicystis rosea]
MTLVMNHRLLALAFIVTASTTALGCIGNAVDENDESIGETSQAFSGYYYYSWSTVGSNNVINLDLGLTPAQATCFLSSVGASSCRGSATATARVETPSQAGASRMATGT